MICGGASCALFEEPLLINGCVCGWVMNIFNLCFYLMFPCVPAFQGFIRE